MGKRQLSRTKKQLHDGLLAWYDDHGRDLPWRSKGGKKVDPYRVWLSEIMLQQTMVATVVPYYTAFVSRWPTLAALGDADLDDVLHVWQGLGYYSRARNLHKCTEVLHKEHDGIFPDTEVELRNLPGIGAYTASAIAAIAFDRPLLPVDGNVERVLARLYAIEEPLPAVKPTLRRLAAKLASSARPGDYAQAIMDLGATVCTVRSPNCGICPWQRNCLGAARGLASKLPRRTPKAARPQRYAIAYIATTADGALYLEKRPEGGLLGGLMQVPLSSWLDKEPAISEAHREAPISADWQSLSGAVRHGFTHFRAQFMVVAARAKRGDLCGREGFWCSPAALNELALSTMVKKIIRHAIDSGAVGAASLN